MESHCYCNVRAAFYLLPGADVIFLFLSTAAALCLARSEYMSLVRDFVKRFEEANAYCSKTRVSNALTTDVLQFSSPMRQLCDCDANRCAQRRGYQLF